MQHPGPTHGMIHEPSHDTHHGLPQEHPQAMASHHHQQHPPHLMLDTSQIGHPRLGSFDASGSIMTPMYQSMPTPTHTHGHHPQTGTKRPLPEDLDMPVHSMSNLEHSELSGMHHVHVGTPYGQGGSTTPGLPHPPPTHHHHRLPDSEPSAKIMRREEGGGAPSVVGQEGMPEPAQRPKGPKLKFTTEDDQLLIELKEQKNLTWKQIADFFPGRSSGTLQVRYCTKLKAKTKQWNQDMDQKLRAALDDYENEKWRIVSSKLGAGFTPAACRDRADELWGDGPTDFVATSSPPEVSAVESTADLYPQHLG